MKIVIACGGTGGHIYPALAVAEELIAQGESNFAFLVGEEGLENEIIGREGYPSYSIKARGLRRQLSYKALSAPLITLLGLFQSFFILRKLRPEVVLATGGYLSFPVVFAAFCLKIPVLLLEPNAVLGLTNKLLLPLAKKMAVAFGETKNRSKSPKIVVTGNPVRKKILSRIKPLDVSALKLFPHKKTVLVFGGSQGAQKINRLMIEMAPLLKKAGFQVIHIVGKRDYSWVKKKMAGEPIGNYRIFDYAFDISVFYAASDLVVSRAGATAISEILSLALPSILIPFPHAAENHQALNAEILKKAGAAEVLFEKDLDAEKLYSIINSILADPGKMEAMRESARKLNPENASKSVVGLLLQEGRSHV